MGIYIAILSMRDRNVEQYNFRIAGDWKLKIKALLRESLK